MANESDKLLVRRNLAIKKQTVDPSAWSQGSPEPTEPDEDLDELEESISLRRRLGGAEDRSDEEDQAMSADPDTEFEPVPAVEIAEDD